MPYQPNIPQPTDQLDDSQGDILGNFQEIYNLVGVNHVQFGAAAGQGKHTEVTLPVNIAPTPTGLNELNIWSQVSANTNALELAWQRSGAGITTELTAARSTFVDPKHGWSRFPSGLLIKWGVGTLAVNPTVVVYPLTEGAPAIVAPVFSNVFCVFLQALSVDPRVFITLDTAVPLNNANFTVRGQTSGVIPFDFYYLAIGIPV